MFRHFSIQQRAGKPVMVALENIRAGTLVCIDDGVQFNPAGDIPPQLDRQHMTAKEVSLAFTRITRRVPLEFRHLSRKHQLQLVQTAFKADDRWVVADSVGCLHNGGRRPNAAVQLWFNGPFVCLSVAAIHNIARGDLVACREHISAVCPFSSIAERLVEDEVRSLLPSTPDEGWEPFVRRLPSPDFVLEPPEGWDDNDVPRSGRRTRSGATEYIVTGSEYEKFQTAVYRQTIRRRHFGIDTAYGTVLETNEPYRLPLAANDAVLVLAFCKDLYDAHMTLPNTPAMLNRIIAPRSTRVELCTTKGVMFTIKMVDTELFLKAFTPIVAPQSHQEAYRRFLDKPDEY